MTKEEAIELNKCLMEYMRITDRTSDYKFLDDNYIALEMGIKALEQSNSDEDCIKIELPTMQNTEGDCISRGALLKTLELLDDHAFLTAGIVRGLIEKASSIQPKKAGHWIKNTLKSTWWYSCSECGCENWSTGMAEKFNNFCPNCGAKMEVSE